MAQAVSQGQVGAQMANGLRSVIVLVFVMELYSYIMQPLGKSIGPSLRQPLSTTYSGAQRKKGTILGSRYCDKR